MIIDRFRRKTRDGRWVPEIDGLRFIAIFSVFVFHIMGELLNRSGRIIPIEPRFDTLSRILANGDRGVVIFFVISGTILALPYARQFLLGGKPVSLRKYYMRRLTRLEPPYILAMLLIFAMETVYQHGSSVPMGGHLLASLLYQHSLIFGQMSPINMVTWSLEVEIQFYVFAPLLMQLFRIKHTLSRRLVLLGVVLAIGLCQGPFSTIPRFAMSILYYLQYFLAGLLVADIFTLDLETMRAWWVWDVVGIGALGILFWAGHDEARPHVVLPVVIGALCVAAMRSVVLRRFLGNHWIAVLGGMCYSIYLLHDAFIAVLFKVTRMAILPAASFPVNLAIQMLVTGVPAVALCVVFFVLVERPCMDPDWPSKLWTKMTGRPGREAKALDTAGIAE
ncbi:acyltransferase family protein [Granulicella tundricola]|uniref:Acyltransferase 3 n=1 Tax=Granulicella tundricola (strain ATCC BAA-1859 / DSM 23138 / MP5ACTX9) TaxID=1198114 RepID=E8WZ23_GRATM|nr:acyltransferase [Granulicella tundricola]ADW69938.1 acyltransferase 3 [Granulicella tundricola MP5ACTX9]